MNANRSILEQTYRSRLLFSGWVAGLAISVAASLTAVSPCAGQSLFEWNNPNGSFYDISTNWTPLGPPTSVDAAQFLLDATYNVQWDAITVSLTPDVGFVDVGTGDVTFLNQTTTQHAFTINEDLTLFNNAQLTNSGLNLNVLGNTFLIQNSALFIDGSHAAGSQFNSTGTINAGAGLLTFDNGATGSLAGIQLNIDSADAATMKVLNGSQVTAGAVAIGNGSGQFASSSGSLIVGGSGSSLAASSLTVGNTDGLGSHLVSVNTDGLIDLGSEPVVINRSGVLNVSSGGQFNSIGKWNLNGALNIESAGLVTSAGVDLGTQAGTLGTATVSGVGSQWNLSSQLTVGRSGDGMLTIQAGGVVSNTSGFSFIGENAGSTGSATVTGSGSQWNSSDPLIVGDAGTGTLNIMAGGIVTSSGQGIGLAASSNGIATVTGPGSQWSNVGGVGGMIIGGSGVGSLNIENGGFVSAGTNGTFGTVVGSDGGSHGQATVTGAGSQWNNSGALTVGNFGDGVLNIEAGGVVSNTTGFIGENAGSTGSATVSGPGSQWNNSANLIVGFAGDGTLTIQDGGVVSNTVAKSAEARQVLPRSPVVARSGITRQA